jgi:hypothetical protein
MPTLDLIYAAATQDSQGTEQVFNDLMKERISAIIQDKREQLAKSLFNSAPETPEAE